MTTHRNIKTVFTRDCQFVKRIDASVNNATLACILQIDEEI